MEKTLSLVDVHIPGYEEGFAPEERANVLSRLNEWHDSDFAGYRRLLRPGSDCHPDLARVAELARAYQKGSTGKIIRDFVLLGTGGSSLGPETLIRALRSPHGEPRFHFMDNNDPQWFAWLLQSLDPEETLFYVVSKSGKTPETISQFLSSIKWMQGKLKGDSWKKHFVLCTDPQSGDLRQLARLWQLDCLDVPPAVGGRFSVLTPVGLFPAAFAGLDIRALLEGAESVTQWETVPLSHNPCALLARALAVEAAVRPITVLMPYSSQLNAFSRWFCQLWAESLGKDGKGLTPYPATGTTDQHSQMQLYMEGRRDKAIILVKVKSYAESLTLTLPKELEELPSFRELKDKSMLDLFHAEFSATRDALTRQGVPNATIELERLDERAMGALFYFWEWATAIAGAVTNVNPFDQPGVEAAKILTKRYLLEGRR
jgi:glucose-6-phosphate isomerase